MPTLIYNTSVSPDVIETRGKDDISTKISQPVPADYVEIIPTFASHDQETLYAKCAVDGIDESSTLVAELTDYITTCFGIAVENIEMVQSLENSDQDHPRIKMVINGIRSVTAE